MAPVTLILGGARSGKSRHAEDLALATGLAPVYVATATAGDAEMQARIGRHRARRHGRGWRDVEEPLQLPRVIRDVAAIDRVLLVDCLTLWLTNLLMEGCDAGIASRELAKAVGAAPGPVIMVASEVGLGIVPDNRLARQFRDLAGWLHQEIARQADTVLFMVAGLPMVVKSGNGGGP